MAILITGGAGYIGSVTVELLRRRGEVVVVLDNLVRGHRAAVDATVPFYRGSVDDRALLARILSEHSIEECVHFAAFTYAGESVEHPVRYFQNNVVEGFSLLEHLLSGGVRRFVFSSTCATYGEPDVLPIDEGQVQRPTNPYGWSKLFLERALTAYDTAYSLKFVALRYFNAAGATERHGEHHDPESHLIPLVLRTAMGVSDSVRVYGTDYPTRDGSAIRDYVHVEDLAAAHMLALDHLRGGGTSEFINLGTGTGFSVLEVIEMVRTVTAAPVAVDLKARRSGDSTCLVARPDKARELLGWRPRYTRLADIVESAWRWHIRHPRGYRDPSSRS
jgi:UDP-glucose 4-epimerase